MNLTVDVTPQVKAELLRRAAANGRPIEAYAGSLLEKAVDLPSAEIVQGSGSKFKRQRAPGRKSLAQLFAESPFRGLDMDFERDPDTGRDINI